MMNQNEVNFLGQGCTVGKWESQNSNIIDSVVENVVRGALED